MDLPKYVELETSRLCNRRCPWCPTHLSHERRSQELLDWALLASAVDSLARHDYRGWLAFHNYNEPLANPRIVDEIVYARGRLPRARLTIFTNGDYLTPELFKRLVDSGLTQLRVTVYPRTSSENPSHARLRQWVAERQLLPCAPWKEAELRQGRGLVLDEPISIELISPDVGRYYDRGGTLPSLSLARRTAPCLLTSHSLSIDYRGQIKMCCNIVTNHAAHEPYLFGDIRECDPIDAWNSPAFVSIRRRHREADWTMTSICNTCRQELPRQ
jgi:hypothetical protein